MPDLTHICATHLDAKMPKTTPGLVVEMPMDSCAFCQDGVCVQSLADDVVLHMRVDGPVSLPKRPSSHALAYMAGWKDGVAGNHPEDSVYSRGGWPSYAEGHARGVAARMREWEYAKTEHPDDRPA